MAVVKNLMVRAGADFSELEKKTQAIQKKMGRWGKDMSKIGGTLTKSITLPAAAAVTGLAAVAIKAGEAADELLTLSAQTGIATDTLQKMQYASRFVDVEVETMTKGMAKVTKAIGKASASGEDYVELAGGLKIAIKDSNGQLRKSEDVFYDSIDAIGKLTNETDKEIAAQELFGKSYQELMPLIKAGSKSLKEYGKQAEELGLVMSDKDVQALGKFDDSMQTLQATMGALGNKVAIALLPALEKLIPVIQDQVVPAIVKIADKAAILIQKFLELDPNIQKIIGAFAGVLVAAGPLISGAGSLLQLASTVKILGTAAGVTKTAGAAGAMTNLGTSLTGLLGPIGLVAAGLAGLLYLTYELSKQDPLKNPYMWNQTAKQYTGTANNLLGGKAGGMGDFKALDSYSKGTDYVPKTGLYELHKGEAVVTKNENMQGKETSTIKHEHTGTITVRGVNNQGELVAVVEQAITNNIMTGNRRIPNKASVIPI